MINRTLIAVGLCLCFGGMAHAEEAVEEVPPPLPQEEGVVSAPQEPQGGVMDEEEVTIIPREEGMVEEYREAGRVYMIKITPAKGPPYYLIDTDGDGSLETRRNDLEPPASVQWRIFSW